MLISGSDTRGSVIDQRGRSDVNIIARVSLETHEILLVSTPRDYDVPLALSGNPMTELTHAGIYGMDVLLGTQKTFTTRRLTITSESTLPVLRKS